MLPFSVLRLTLPSIFETVYYNVIPAVFTYTRKPAATFFGTNFAELQMVDAVEEGGVTLVLRVVRSFPHRNIRPLVLKGVPLSLSPQQLLERSKEAVVSEASFPPPFRFPVAPI